MRAKSRKTPDPAEYRLKMAGLCARSEQCSFDIKTKLYKVGLSSQAIESIIDFLKEEAFLSDRRYAKSYANDKVRFAAWGRLKIRHTLVGKRIPSNYISDALSLIDEDDYEDALDRAARAKASSLDLSERDGAVKLYRHLLSRGFESDISSRKVKELIKENREKS